jgi:hypothetical protein
MGGGHRQSAHPQRAASRIASSLPRSRGSVPLVGCFLRC